MKSYGETAFVMAVVSALGAGDAASGLVMAFLPRVLLRARNAGRARDLALTANIFLLGNVSRGIAERLVRMYLTAFLLGLASGAVPPLRLAGLAAFSGAAFSGACLP